MSWHPEDDRTLRRLWPKPDLTRAAIARQLHCSPWTVWHHARLLGLPMREGNRDTTMAREANERRMAAKKQAPQMYACTHCGYRSTEPTHELCANRQGGKAA